MYTPKNTALSRLPHWFLFVLERYGNRKTNPFNPSYHSRRRSRIKLGVRRHRFPSHTMYMLALQSDRYIDPNNNDSHPQTTSNRCSRPNNMQAGWICVGVTRANAHPIWRTSHTVAGCLRYTYYIGCVETNVRQLEYVWQLVSWQPNIGRLDSIDYA